AVEYDDVGLVEQTVVEVAGRESVVVEHLAVSENLSDGGRPVVGFDFQDVDAFIVIERQVEFVVEAYRHVVETHLCAIESGEAGSQVEGHVPHGASGYGDRRGSGLDAIDREFDVELFALTVAVVAHSDGKGVSFLSDRERIVEIRRVDKYVVGGAGQDRGQVLSDGCIRGGWCAEGRLLDVGYPEHLFLPSGL